jgi:hypothetical protein
MTTNRDEPRHSAKDMPRAGDAAVPTADAGAASNHLGQDDGGDVARSGDDRGQGTPPPHAPSGVSTALQPGGTVPGGGPGASVGSLGTSGGPAAGAPSGAVKRSGI